MSTNAIFKITNGTDTVDLLADATDLYGFHIESWKPAIAEYKNGGVWRDSPLAHGRRIAGKYFSNVIETMTLAVHGYSADDVALRLSDLRQLLEQASDYWIAPYSNTPVWVVARAKGETNTRYALLYAGRVTEDNNPYASPFLQPGDQATMVELPFTFERGHWASSEPGARECAPPLIPTRKSFVPTESGDDALVIVATTTIATTGTTLGFGNNGSGALHTGIRFKNVTIPPGAKILSATICFENPSTQSATAVNVQIYGEKTVNPAIFSTYADFMARTMTTLSETWADVSAVTGGDDWNTPDFAQVIQEIVDQPTWLSGKNLAIFIRDNGSSSSASRSPAAYDSASAHEPILTVTWMDEAMACDDAEYADQAIVAANSALAQITGLYWYDVSITTFSENLLNTTTFPYSLLPATVAVGDIVYFNSDTLAPDGGPFNNLFFRFSPNSASLTVAFEKWNGATWVSATDTDYTGELSGTGVGTVHWIPSSWSAFDMGTLGGTNNPGVTGYTLRARVTAVVTTNSPQVLEHPYSIVWPYVEFPASSSPGDLPPLAEWELRHLFDGSAGTPDWVMFGLRQIARGENFTSFLNASDTQQPYGLSCAVATDTSFQADSTAPTGREASCTFATTATMDERVTFTFASALTQDYLGRYRVFLITETTGGAVDMSVRLRVSFGQTTFYTDTATVKVSANLHEMGVLDLNNFAGQGEMLSSIFITIQASRNSGSGSLVFRSLVLMPTDEFSAEFSSQDSAIGLTANSVYLDADSVRLPKAVTRGVVRDSSDNFYGLMRAGSAGPLIYQVNQAQRLFVLVQGDDLIDVTGTNVIAPYKLSRYFGLRGRT